MARSQELARLFQHPDSPAQRRYEICRAYFHERTPADELARRFHADFHGRESPHNPEAIASTFSQDLKISGRPV